MQRLKHLAHPLPCYFTTRTLSIGSASDSYIGKCYEADFVKDVAQEQINSAELMIEQYNKLLASGFLSDPSDKSFVEDIVVTLGYIKNEANYLKAYVESGSDADVQKFEYNRDEAWKKISKLLGFEDTEEK